MPTETFPVASSEELMAEVRRTAKERGLSLSDALRQATKPGSPTPIEQLGPGGARLKLLTPEEQRRAYRMPNPEFDALEHRCAPH